MIQPIYLDYNGTTPHDPEVIEAMRPFFETEFGNPSSSHWYGIKPKQAVEKARRQVAASAGAACHSDTVEVSHVKEAMGIPLVWAQGTLRFSVGRMTTEAQIDKTIRVVAEAVNKSKHVG